MYAGLTNIPHGTRIRAKVTGAPRPYNGLHVSGTITHPQCEYSVITNAPVAAIHVTQDPISNLPLKIPLLFSLFKGTMVEVFADGAPGDIQIALNLPAAKQVL